MSECFLQCLTSLVIATRMDRRLLISLNPVNARRQNDVFLTYMRRDDVAWASGIRNFDVLCCFPFVGSYFQYIDFIDILHRSLSIVTVPVVHNISLFMILILILLHVSLFILHLLTQILSYRTRGSIYMYRRIISRKCSF